MTVNSFNIEFGYELLSAVPYAYELYKCGLLSETISGVDTESLYYFSPKHTINNTKRSWYNTDTARLSGLPYTFIHTPWPEQKMFPPYKDVYKNNVYKFKKPTLCICNRYNVEWSYKPINFFSEDILEWLFSNLSPFYEIVYFPVSIPEEFNDDAEPIKLNDIAIAKKYSVKVFTDLCAGKSWNLTMLQVFANCEHYITMNGGYSILASMFSGTNIIYSKPGQVEARELANKSFWRWYPNINNVRTLHVPSYDDLKSKVKAIYIDKKPCINILVRTHRQNYLKNCMQSIQKQTYNNINVVLICDTARAIKYTTAYNARVIHIDKSTYKLNAKPDNDFYGMSFIYNRYLDTAQKLVSGYVMLLDDDDKLVSENAVSTIADSVSKDKLVVWRADMNNKIIPSYSFGKDIKLYDITGIAFCYHTDNIKHTDWSEWKRADYRTAYNLTKVLDIVWVDAVLTAIQDCPGNGVKQDLSNYKHFKIEYIDGTKREQYFCDEEVPAIQDYFLRIGAKLTLIT